LLIFDEGMLFPDAAQRPAPSGSRQFASLRRFARRPASLIIIRTTPPPGAHGPRRRGREPIVIRKWAGGATTMAAETEQDQLVKQARLRLSPPEVVFEELRKQAQRSRYGWYHYDDQKIEPMLLERNEPLINLGLACFGGNREVFRALYKHSLTQPQNDTDAIYKRGLRIGCLSNQIAAKVNPDFPAQLIGTDEMQRIIARGEDAETTAIMRNPSVSDRPGTPMW
jgi:hypothetical protein